MSDAISMLQLLGDKTFRIPEYQRDFSWTTNEVSELLDDIQEASEIGGHYLGVFVLAGKEGQPYEVVDGQQRLSSLTLIISAFLKQLRGDERYRISYEDTLLYKDRERSLRLDFGRNAAFVRELLDGRPCTPDSGGQRKLQAAYRYASDRAAAISAAAGPAEVMNWLDTIKSLKAIQFAAEDTGRAIRLFQTVNDRGKQLTTMDKAKALLVYYSNRFLSGELDHVVNLAFGDCFQVYDRVRQLAAEDGFRIKHINSKQFSEDDILRYHYLAYDDPSASEYTASAENVYGSFLKGTLKRLCSEPNKLRDFIRDYVSDLKAFTSAFGELVQDTRSDTEVLALLVILGLNARLYPLAIRLRQRDLLRESVPGTTADLLRCIEICDVRVYKVHGSTPEADIGRLSHISRTTSVQVLADGLRRFTEEFSWDFKTKLTHEKMYNHEALNLLLLRHDESENRKRYEHTELASMVKEDITQEHIIAQTPSWNVESQGFESEEDFRSIQDRLGNMALLSRAENSRCNNRSTYEKMTDPELYAKSRFAGTRRLAHAYKPQGGVFTKSDMLQRSERLAEAMAAEEWRLW